MQGGEGSYDRRSLTTAGLIEEVGVTQRGRRDCEKFYFKPMPSQMAVIVFVKFVANKGATNSTN